MRCGCVWEMSEWAGRTKSGLSRALWVLRQIELGDFPNCQGLAMEYEVSAKSIQRDIDFLRDELGLPLEYDSSRHGYCLTGPLPDLPLGKLTEGELLAMFLAGQAAGALRGTRMGELLERAVKRVSLYAEESYDVGLREVRDALSVVEGAQMEVVGEVFVGLERGVKERRVTEFFYEKPGSGKRERRRVHPWHLAHVNGGWYLFAWDEVRGAERTFAVSRVEGVEVLRERFERPENFSARGFLKGSFGVFGGGKKGKEWKVVLRFGAWAAALVRERRWHESEERKELAGGGVELSLTLTSLEEVERWVLGWGPHVEVVRPVELRRRLAVVGRELVERYGVES